jgi:hypothetical protein
MKCNKIVLLTVLILLSSMIGNAQPFFKWDDSIGVKVNGSYIANPWAGGLNFVQVSDIDMNMDGIKDLFVFDRTGNKIRTYINKGTANAVNYKYDPQYETKFPYLHDWALLKDYNCDGKEDIFTSVSGGFAIYKNTSNAINGLQFTLVTPLQYSEYNPGTPPPYNNIINLYVSSVDIPAIVDVDNDGDLDIITFGIFGTYMEYHQNQSMELFGTCDSLKFKMRNRCWGYATEDAYSNIFTLHDTCYQNVPNPELPTDNTDDAQRSVDRHSGSCTLCLDLDGDGDKDIVVGGVSYDNLTMVSNGGTIHNARMNAVDVAFPSNNSSTTAVELTVFPCAYYVDVNNDNVKDLIVSPNAPNVSENFNSMVYYKNTGTNSAPVFQFQQSNLLQDNMIEVGEGAYPVLFDYDNDGLKDLFIGNYGYFTTGVYRTAIAQFKNIGTATFPKFELITRDYDSLSTLGIKNMIPAFGDLDGDGDADMMIGDYYGRLYYFENTATAGTTANFVLSIPTFKNANHRIIDVGDFAAPQIIDIDNDGKNDLIIGGRNGKIAYYHHIGSATSSTPLMDSVTHFFGNVNVCQHGYPIGYSYPFCFKQNGVTKLLIGADDGYLHMYDNIDGNLSGNFSLVDSTYEHIFQGTHTSPTGADIDNDGYMDLIVGNYEGGVSYYKGGPTDVASVDNIDNSIHWGFNLFPNPANNSITVKVNNDNGNSSYTVDLYTVLGQLVVSQKIINNSITLNTQNLSQGIYICKVSETNASRTITTGDLIKRLIIQH